ncbi:MAG: acyl-CoA dehydrogenase [Gammaproteobacteria bacterium]|jgi:alkylation response protein AidB-like acyl-CoA dehydrogenase|nr:MAG: acyl-CoA dehydrogenase [Gammaproteobacteria bacterium]|tara:strand:+ start:714 stop:1940 length:1227 start_codon:yes stop_codon:yes gene_type:complete
MDFNDTPQEAEFRAKCRAWLEANAELKTKKTNSAKNMNVGNKSLLEAAAEWQKKKYDAGWAMIHWPKEFGGIGATPIERIIWAQEESKFNVPKGVYEIGLGMAGPVMMEYATDEQKERYLPPMAEGKEIWCQLFSEPSAGSDVAGLRSKAVQDGENWIVNGQKVWTSGAHFSDFGILVVRHDPSLEKHKGLTFFFVDMKSPGIEVKPIKQLTGGSSFNEVYFNDVVIPDSQRLGEIGDGWKVAITTLMNERLAVGDADGVDANEAFELAKKHDKDGEQLIDNNAVRESIADWYCEASGLKNTKLRTMSALSRGDTPGPEASITKIVSANKLQAIGNFGMDSSDMSGMLMDEESDFIKFQMAWMGAAGLRIAGGTDEILKNIIAERVLGLPQEARADKGLAFKDIPSGS